jgi:hypothetical protein
MSITVATVEMKNIPDRVIPRPPNTWRKEKAALRDQETRGNRKEAHLDSVGGSQLGVLGRGHLQQADWAAQN